MVAEHRSIRLHAERAQIADQPSLRERIRAIAAVERSGRVCEHVRKIAVLLPEQVAVFLHQLVHSHAVGAQAKLPVDDLCKLVQIQAALTEIGRKIRRLQPPALLHLAGRIVQNGQRV